MRPVFDPTGGPDVLVEKMIGQAYETVKRVYTTLPEIKRLDAVLTEIPILAQTTVDAALAGAMPPIREELAGYINAAEVHAASAEESAEAAAQSAIDAAKVSRMFPFSFNSSQPVYDVTTISGDPTATTAGLALWVKGDIVYDFTILSGTTFMLNEPTLYPEGAQMRIIINARFDDLVKNFDELQDGFTAEFQQFLKGSALEIPVRYTAGILLERPTQTVSFGNDTYRPTVESLPFTTNDWVTDSTKLVLVGEGTLRREITAPSGASILGAVLQDGTTSTVQEAITLGDKDLRNMIADPEFGPGIIKVDQAIEYPFDSTGFSLTNAASVHAGGNPTGLLKEESVDFYDPLTRTTPVEILPGSPVGIFDNNTSHGVLLGTGRYTQDSAGITKISGTGSAVLMLPATYGGDIDMEISMRSLYEIGGADSNAPRDANLAILLRVQDEQNYCVIQVNNSHLLTASLSIREAVAGTEHVRATYGNIVINATSPKMSNNWPTLRVILRKNRVTVSLNGVRVLSNISLQTLRWGRHGIRVYKQGTVIKDLKIRTKTKQSAPAVSVVKEGLLYGDGEQYVGWADAAALNDGSVFIMWRESSLNTPSGGHQQGGYIAGAKWRDGKLVTAPVTHYAADGVLKEDYQEQDCVLSKVYYNGNDHLVLFTRRFRNTPADNICYVSYCNIGLNDPADPSKWPTRTVVSFPTVLQFVAGHSPVLMAADGVTFVTSFYGPRVGHTAYACVVATSTDLITWTVKSIPVDPLATSNPITGGDPEPCLLRGPGASLLLYARARTMVSHDDGLTWCQYDLLGGNGGRGRHFPGAFRTENGAFLMYRRYLNATTPADSVLVPLQINDGFSWKSADFTGGVVLGTQQYGQDLPGKANPGGDSGCLRVAYLGGDQYLLLDYRQRIDEMSPRLYQYLINAK